MTWAVENINEYMKDLAKEAKGLQRMGGPFTMYANSSRELRMWLWWSARMKCSVKWPMPWSGLACLSFEPKRPFPGVRVEWPRRADEAGRTR